MTVLLQRAPDHVEWVDGIDVCEHHQIDFREVRRQGTALVVVRAGRGTRQDSRWVEHVRAAELARLAVGSYWYLYPSHTSAHHQAELWMAAIRSAPSSFAGGHWADVSTTDGFDPTDLARYVAGFLRRMDELLGHTTGVFTATGFWRSKVRFDISDRPRWHSDPSAVNATDARDHTLAEAPSFDWPHAYRTCPADRGGPGRHRVQARQLDGTIARPENGLHLVARGPNESVSSWRQRWLRTPDVAELQLHLNDLGAQLLVDGVYGPATDAAVRSWCLLWRRDCRVPQLGTISRPLLPMPDRTTL